MDEKQKPSLSFFHPIKFIGTWFGVGLAPYAAGTCASIAALPFAWVIQTCFGSVALFIASILVFILGVILCNLYAPYTDSLDPREMVIDEISGQWLLLSFMFPTLSSYITGLVLFRFFDIVKPWPISVADRKIHGGFGVMFDDALAAIYPLILFGIVYLCGYGHVIINFLAN